MDKEEYIKKAEELLNQETYKIIPADPTNRQKNKLIQMLKDIKAECEMNEDTYKKMYPTGVGIATFYRLPKIHKTGVPLSIPYGTAKELARILKSMVGKSPYNVQTPRTCITIEEHQSTTTRMHHIL